MEYSYEVQEIIVDGKKIVSATINLVGTEDGKSSSVTLKAELDKSFTTNPTRAAVIAMVEEDVGASLLAEYKVHIADMLAQGLPEEVTTVEAGFPWYKTEVHPPATE